MAKNTGHNHRRGAVINRSQTYNPKTGSWVKRDSNTGRFMDAKADSKPQVIWPNAILASTAVGIAMNLLMNWTKKCEGQILYYEYDGNKGTIKPHLKCEMPWENCEHYKLEHIGDIQL